jgi:hypothetical protein
MIMIWTYENMVHFKPFKSSYLFLGLLFLAISLHISFFCFIIISYIESLEYIPNKIQTQKCMYIEALSPYFSTSKVHYYIFDVYIL